MRVLSRTVGVLAPAGLSFLVGAVAWLYWYDRDLPSVDQLHSLVSGNGAEIHLKFCEDELRVQAASAEEMSPFLLSALRGAEGEPDVRNPYWAALADLSGRDPKKGGKYSWQIARILTCRKGSIARARLDELRLANAIHRRFDTAQAQTIYLNLAPFGTEIRGVRAASREYLGKDVSALSLGEAALLAGMLRRPVYYSPVKHPDRAVTRRNAVLDEMVRKGSVSRDEAERAKGQPPTAVLESGDPKKSQVGEGDGILRFAQDDSVI